MTKVDKKIVLYELCVIVLALLVGYFVPIFKEYNISILIILSMIVFKSLFGFEKKKHKDTKETIIALCVFIITFMIIYYLFGFLVGFTVLGLNTIYSIVPIIIYVLGREFLRYNVLSKIKNNKVLLLSILMFMILDLSNSTNMILENINYKPIIMYITILLPIITNNIVLSYISKKSGYMPVLFYTCIMSSYRYIIPILPNTTLSATTAIDTIVPILLWVRMNTYYGKKESKHDTTNDNLINLSILVFPVVVMMIVLYFTSGYFRYEAIVIGSTNMEPDIRKGDIIIVDKEYHKMIEPGDMIAYKKNNTLMINRVEKKDYQNNKKIYYLKDNEMLEEQEIIGRINIRIKYIGWPALWFHGGNQNE